MMFIIFRRLAAREISALKPALQTAGVRLVGVGVEPLGVQEFIDGKFFDGDLFVDVDKAAYKAMGFKKMGFLGLGGAVFAKKAREIAAKVSLSFDGHCPILLGRRWVLYDRRK